MSVVSSGGLAAEPTLADRSGEGHLESARATAAPVGGIDLVRGPIRYVIGAAPVGVLLVLGAGGFFVDDPMYATGLAAVIVAFVIFAILATRVPVAFRRLRESAVVSPADQPRLDTFEQGATSLMNGRWQLIGALGGAILDFARFPVGVGGLDVLFGAGPRSLMHASLLRLASMGAEIVLGAIIGLVLWRSILLGITVFRFGHEFRLNLKLNNPDKCGGFRPLGDVCLLNASLYSAPAVWLGAWIVIAPRSDLYRTLYVEQHIVFLAITTLLAFVAFFVPLWTIHTEMLREAALLRPDVDKVAQQIDTLSRRLLERSSELSTDEAATIAKDLDIQQATYARVNQIPTWPIDVRLALRFGASQVIPAMSLLGLSGPIVDAAGKLASFAAPS